MPMKHGQHYRRKDDRKEVILPMRVSNKMNRYLEQLVTEVKAITKPGIRVTKTWAIQALMQCGQNMFQKVFLGFQDPHEIALTHQIAQRDKLVSKGSKDYASGVLEGLRMARDMYRDYLDTYRVGDEEEDIDDY